MKTIAALSAPVILMTFSVAQAGDLNPPPGPVAPTLKTLVEVEPRSIVNDLPGDASAVHVIDTPGSYYLDAEVAGVSDRHGIRIEARDVTLDLNGFRVLGATDSFSGIRVADGVENVTIRDGVLRGWGEHGLSAAGAESVSVDGVRAINNVLDGLVAGDSAIISGCAASTNGRNGIIAGDESIVRHSTASGNAEAGFVTGFNCVVSECASRENGSEATPIRGEAGCTSSSLGFLIGRGSSVMGCTTIGNLGIGFLMQSDVTLTDCSSTDNLLCGFRGENNVEIFSCISTNNGGWGIRLDEGGLVGRCTAVSNADDGIRTEALSVVEGCVARRNGISGIVVTGESVVRGCIAQNNDVAGISMSGMNGRIQGNDCVLNSTGILATGTAHTVVKNMCASNGVNYDIEMGNAVGAIVVNPNGAGAWDNISR